MNSIYLPLHQVHQHIASEKYAFEKLNDIPGVLFEKKKKLNSYSTNAYTNIRMIHCWRAIDHFATPSCSVPPILPRPPKDVQYIGARKPAGWPTQPKCIRWPRFLDYNSMTTHHLPRFSPCWNQSLRRLHAWKCLKRPYTSSRSVSWHHRKLKRISAKKHREVNGLVQKWTKLHVINCFCTRLTLFYIEPLKWSMPKYSLKLFLNLFW